MTTHFFTTLPIHEASLSTLLEDEQRFAAVPGDWHIIVTDIKNSTAAFRAGRHEDINLIATGCIIATLNLAYPENIQVPFFFGGDGATLIVPPVLLAPAMGVLQAHRENTRRNFDLTLRVGAVQVADLLGESYGLKISRLAMSPSFSIPIVLGTALSEAERRIKAQDDEPAAEEHREALDLNGMECRWDRIEPAATTDEVVCLLVSVQANHGQASVFKEVVDLLDRIYGPFQSRNPVSLSQLQLKGSFEKLARETRARLGRLDWVDLIKNWVITQIGRLVFLKRVAGRQYMASIVELTDTLVIDGRINTVIAGTPDQRQRLEHALNELEAAGKILYGLFVSQESVMSCYVRDREDSHIHFIDGADGGYTMAATMLKKKYRTL